MNELPEFQEFSLLNMPGLGMHVGALRCVWPSSPLEEILWKQVSWRWCATSVSGSCPAAGNAEGAKVAYVICVPGLVYKYFQVF